MAIPAAPLWQVVTVGSVLLWLQVARRLKLTQHIRKILQPTARHYVKRGIPTILFVQKHRRPWLDTYLTITAVAVSMEFYTAFLPILFWTGHSKLARDSTLLMALCVYTAAAIKDVVCAPRPPSPPVWRREVIRGAGLENGLPSSHTVNVVALSLHLLRHCHLEGLLESHPGRFWCLTAGLVLVSASVIFGRLYLGMHSLVDIGAGLLVGILLPLFWAAVGPAVDTFIARGENVVGFCFGVAVLLQGAYPVPQAPTPSHQDATAFNAVVFGIIAGIHRTYSRYHSGAVGPLSVGPNRGLLTFVARTLVGFPLVLLAKAVGKAAAIRVLPSVGKLAGISLRSTAYVSFLTTSMDENGGGEGKKECKKVERADVALLKKTDGDSDEKKGRDPLGKQRGFGNVDLRTANCAHGTAVAGSCSGSEVGLAKLAASEVPLGALRHSQGESLSSGGVQDGLDGCKDGREGWVSSTRLLSWGGGEQEAYDVDTGIRFVSYACLAWMVAEGAPNIFSLLGV